tara:strand:+ start:294 stop:488 length:195 start_codon:yes stop_codon:yes gene_type:complete
MSKNINIEDRARPDGFIFEQIKHGQHPQDPGPILGPDNEPLKEGQCICGDFKCKESYEHWTSGV